MGPGTVTRSPTGHTIRSCLSTQRERQHQRRKSHVLRQTKFVRARLRNIHNGLLRHSHDHHHRLVSGTFWHSFLVVFFSFIDESSNQQVRFDRPQIAKVEALVDEAPLERFGNLLPRRQWSEQKQSSEEHHSHAWWVIFYFFCLFAQSSIFQMQNSYKETSCTINLWPRLFWNNVFRARKQMCVWMRRNTYEMKYCNGPLPHNCVTSHGLGIWCRKSSTYVGMAKYAHKSVLFNVVIIMYVIFFAKDSFCTEK